MLTVWCVLNGDKYSADDVYILRSMVARHLSQPHHFRCLSDREIPGVSTLIPREKWPGWWAKLLLFRYATGVCLYLDLDCVVVGDLDPLADHDGTLHTAKNWAQSGHGGCQSSVMSWFWGYANLPAKFNADLLERPQNGNCGAYQGLWGDQEFITRELGEPGQGGVGVLDGIYSYKYHCMRPGRPPADARVVCFHGEPKPADVDLEWIRSERFI